MRKIDHDASPISVVIEADLGAILTGRRPTSGGSSCFRLCTWGSAENFNQDETYTPDRENPAGIQPGKHLSAPGPWPEAGVESDTFMQAL